MTRSLMCPSRGGTLLIAGQGVRGLLVWGGGGGGALALEDMAGWGEGEGMCIRHLFRLDLFIFL